MQFPCEMSLCFLDQLALHGLSFWYKFVAKKSIRNKLPWTKMNWNNNNNWGTAIAQWIRLHLPSCCQSRSSPKHTIYALYVEKTKINKKWSGLAHLKNNNNNFSSLAARQANATRFPVVNACRLASSDRPIWNPNWANIFTAQCCLKRTNISKESKLTYHYSHYQWKYCRYGLLLNSCRDKKKPTVHVQQDMLMDRVQEIVMKTANFSS